MPRSVQPLSVQPRGATPADAEELTRLRAVMLATLGVDASDPAWRDACVRDLRRRIADEALAVAYVVDRHPSRAEDPSGPRHAGGGPLAASGIGLVRCELPAPGRPDGRSGYLLSVSTDEEFRGRGYATAIVTRLLEWFVARGVAVVDLHASQYGVQVYRRLGFIERAEPSLRWRAPAH
jgi:ribosomal protein S18 acetylase RimI-like enzyme